MLTAAAVLIVAAFVAYVMTPEERARLLRAVLAFARRLAQAAVADSPQNAPFHYALRTRTRWPIVTAGIVTASVLVFGLMLVAPGRLSESAVLVDWGGNFAPRTTNGEWWRLVTSLFVHAGMLHLLATVIALIPLGLILERLVGPVAFATVYIAAGVLTGLLGLAGSPLNVVVGPSPAIFGAYGFLLASMLWGLASPSSVSVPLAALKRIGACAAAFVLYNLATSHTQREVEIAGLIVGLIGGMVLSRDIGHQKPPTWRLAAAAAATLVMVLGCAVSLRGIADVRPQLARVVAFETRAVGAYDGAVAQFRKGWISARALADAIDHQIVPELKAARARFLGISGRIPREHQPLVAATHEYFALREASWHRRAEALRASNATALRDAESVERAALKALDRIRLTDGPLLDEDGG